MKTSSLILSVAMHLFCVQVAAQSAMSTTNQLSPSTPSGVSVKKLEKPLIRKPQVMPPVLEVNEFDGIFEFKGLTINKTFSDVFESPESRVILRGPSPNSIVGFLPANYKSVKSTDFTVFSCSNTIGKAARAAYDREIADRVRTAKYEWETEQTDATRLDRKFAS